jgi:hypothetical protein
VKLFKVTLKVEMMVVGTDAGEARYTANRHIEEEVRTIEASQFRVDEHPVNIEFGLPYRWEESCIPWGSPDGKTIGEYIAEMKASQEKKTP